MKNSFKFKISEVFKVVLFMIAISTLLCFKVPESQAVSSKITPQNRDSLAFSALSYSKGDTILTQGYILSKEQKKGLPSYVYDNTDADVFDIYLAGISVVGIETNEHETLVDLVVCSLFETWQFVISEYTFLRDLKTGDMYKIREIKSNIPLGKVLVLKDWNSEYLCLTLVFPPLDSEVEIVDFIDEPSKTADFIESNVFLGVWYDFDINVKKLHRMRTSMHRTIE